MVYLADYEGIDGTSISEVVAEVAPELDADLRQQLDANVDAAQALEGPFDQLILGDDSAPGRVALLDLIESLQAQGDTVRSEEHTSELQSLMSISYDVFCLKKKILTQIT